MTKITTGMTLPSEIVQPSLYTRIHPRKKRCPHEWTVVGEDYYLSSGRSIIAYCPHCEGHAENSERSIERAWEMLKAHRQAEEEWQKSITREDDEEMELRVNITHGEVFNPGESTYIIEGTPSEIKAMLAQLEEETKKNAAPSESKFEVGDYVVALPSAGLQYLHTTRERMNLGLVIDTHEDGSIEIRVISGFSEGRSFGVSSSHFRKATDEEIKAAKGELPPTAGDYVVAKSDDNPYTITTASKMKLGKVTRVIGNALAIEIIKGECKGDVFTGLGVEYFRKATTEEIEEGTKKEVERPKVGEYVVFEESDGGFITAGKAYQVNEVDVDGDFWIRDNDGDELFFTPEDEDFRIIRDKRVIAFLKTGRALNEFKRGDIVSFEGKLDVISERTGENVMLTYRSVGDRWKKASDVTLVTPKEHRLDFI